MKLIDKDAVVAEIDNRIKKNILLQQKPEMSDLQKELQDKIDCLNSIKGYILNTIEVKEVYINEEVKRKWDSFSLCYDELRGCDVVVWPYWVYKQVCKYFFELGVKAQKGE